MNDQESTRYGKWIKAGKLHGQQLYQCTNCLCVEPVPEYETVTFRLVPVWEWCPNCGAKMKGADQE